MAGQKIVLSGVSFTDATLPKVRDDAILSAGSLLLFDPGHSLGVFAGVPAAAATVPNVAWKEAAAMLGAGDANTLSLVAAGSTLVANKFLVERSTKGGIHGIVTQSAMVGGDTPGYTLRAADAIRNYMFANLAHSFYVSLWTKVTRPALVAFAGSSPISYQTDGTANLNYLFKTNKGLPQPSANGSRSAPAQDESGVAAGTDRFVNLKSGAIVGTGPSNVSYPKLQLGLIADPYGFSDNNKGTSRIIYRAYIEDLTVSGRTYAEVDAIDYALWQVAFGGGGRFAGDTYTNPATMP